NFHIAVLREADLSPLFFQHTPQVGDPHSILASGDCLYVVSTATDEVLSFDITDTALLNPRVVWKASDAGIDTHHVNSIVEKDGDLMVSAFGPKAGDLWSTAANGYIHNISLDRRIKEGIYHPHTLSVHDDQIYYCESHRGWFCSLEGPVFQLNGYSRGISWCSDDLVCVGTSIGRKVSKSTGLLANPADPGEEIGQCAVTLRACATGDLLYQRDLSWFGPEIYDVLLLDRATEPASTRLATLE
ncbi:MAG: DUF4915 domain-containing protein, partial [Bacteroidota bacterium]